MLNFAHLRKQNVLRCTADDGFRHPLNRWSAAEWTNAMAGEAGEACNVAKKIIRFRDNVPGNKKSEAEYLIDLGKEVADTVIYADLTLAAQDLDLAKFIIQAFNEKSQEIGCGIFL